MSCSSEEELKVKVRMDAQDKYFPALIKDGVLTPEPRDTVIFIQDAIGNWYGVTRYGK